MAVHYNLSQADEWATAGKIAEGDRLYASIKRLEVDVLSRLDGIVYVSQFMRQYTEETHRHAKAIPAAIIPNFLPQPSTMPPVNIVGDLINIGSLEPRKNQAYLLRVLAEANRFGHRYSLTLVGNGPDWRQLHSLAKHLGVARQVRFVGSCEDAAALLRGHRVYVHSATMENLTIALIEALAHGRPVLAPRVGGIPEIITDGEEGVFWSLDDPADGAAKLVAILSNPALYSEHARRAAERFEKAFDARIVADRLATFLCSFLDHNLARNGEGSSTPPYAPTSLLA